MKKVYQLNYTSGFVLGLALLIGLTPGVSRGNSVTNYFSGLASGCPTFGSSVQNALQLIGRTKQLLIDLKQECPGLEASISDVESLKREITRLSNDPKTVDLLKAQANVENLTLLANTLPSAVASGINAYDDALLGSVSSTLAQQRVELALKTSETEIHTGYLSTYRKYSTLPDIQTTLHSLSNQLPRIEACAAKKPEIFTQVIGSLLPAVASLGTPAMGVAASASGSILRDLGKYIVQSKYARYINKLQKMEMQAALGCAFENIQFAYCSADDGIKLIDWAAQKQTKTNTVNLDQGSAWAGYDLLTRDLGILTDWIQKLQNGQNPSRIEDASYPITTDQIESAYRSAKFNVYGFIGDALRDVKGLQDQKTRGIELLTNVYNAIVNSNALINPFIRAKEANDLAYFLVSKTYDDLKLVNTNSDIQGLGLVQHPENRKKLDDRLVETIAAQFEKLLAGDGTSSLIGSDKILASILANRRSDDPEDLIAQAFVAADGTKSPYHVLENLKNWLNSLIDSGMPTLERAYVDISNPSVPAQLILGLAASTFTEVDKAMTTIGSADKATDKISALFTAFNILKSRDRFLVQRVATLVRVQLKSVLESASTEKEIREIVQASNLELFNKLVSFGLRNRQTVKMDLVQARSAHKKHFRLLYDFYDREWIEYIEKESDPEVKSYYCARIIGLEEIPKKLRTLCLGQSIQSIYHDPEGGAPIEFKFVDYAYLPYEQRACAYRNFLRKSSLFELIGKNETLQMYQRKFTPRTP